MVSTAAQVGEIVASREAVGTILRRIAPIGTTGEKGQRRPRLRGVTLRVLLTPPLPWNRRSEKGRTRFLEKRGGDGNDEQSFSTTLDLGGQFLCMGEDSVGVLGTGALPIRYVASGREVEI